MRTFRLSTQKTDSIGIVSFLYPTHSPRSIEAINSLGFELHKLYYISFEDFLYTHPELKSISKDLQEKRYNHYEAKRQEKISKAKEKRREIIDSTKSKNSRSKSFTDYTREQASTMIKEEKEKLRLLKNQQMGELKNMIEFEFKMEEIRKKNEQKMLMQQQKEEELRKERMRQAKEREIKQRMQEKKKEERLKAEMEEFERKEKERKEEEYKQYIEEMKKKEELEKERQRRQLESRKRQEEFRKKIEGILNAQQKELMEKQRELLEKEAQRKKNLEELKKENYYHSLEKRRKNQERIQKALSRNDSTFLNRQNDFERKQKIAEELRAKFAQERYEKQKQQEILNKQKEQEIMEVLRRNDEIIQKRIETYNKKQQLLEERQRARDTLMQQQLKERHIKLSEKERKCIEARQRNEKLIEENRNKLLLKINSADEKINKQKNQNMRSSMEKYIEFTMRKDDIEDNIRAKEKAMEYKRMQRLEEIEEKNRRVEEMKQQKMELYEQRRKMNRDMQKHKERMLIKFDYLMKNSKTKSKEEIMRELFDEDSNSFLEENTKQKTNNVSKSKSNVDLLESKKKEEAPKEKTDDFVFLTNLGNKPPEKKPTIKEDTVQSEVDIKEDEKKELKDTNINLLNNNLPNNADNTNK